MEDIEPKEKDDCNLTSEEKLTVRFRQKLKYVLQNITIEPLLFFHSISFGLVWVLVPSVYFDKICKVDYFEC